MLTFLIVSFISIFKTLFIFIVLNYGSGFLNNTEENYTSSYRILELAQESKRREKRLVKNLVATASQDSSFSQKVLPQD